MVSGDYRSAGDLARITWDTEFQLSFVPFAEDYCKGRMWLWLEVKEKLVRFAGSGKRHPSLWKGNFTTFICCSHCR